LGIVASLTIHPDAADDLRKLMQTDPFAAGKVLALLQQAKHDPKIIDSLLDHDFGTEHTAPYHVSKWQEFWRIGYDLWRLKIWLEPKGSLRYRIVYAYDPRSLQYHVLAIVHRDFNYESDHEFTQRILKAYKDLGLTIH
jgi:mRNA-degrading endonuclease RelE of RelBE toxin-antitoxin system